MCDTGWIMEGEWVGGGYLFYTRAALNKVGPSPTRPLSSD